MIEHCEIIETGGYKNATLSRIIYLDSCHILTYIIHNNIIVLYLLAVVGTDDVTKIDLR